VSCRSPNSTSPTRTTCCGRVASICIASSSDASDTHATRMLRGNCSQPSYSHSLVLRWLTVVRVSHVWCLNQSPSGRKWRDYVGHRSKEETAIEFCVIGSWPFPEILMSSLQECIMVMDGLARLPDVFTLCSLSLYVVIVLSVLLFGCVPCVRLT